MENRNFGKRGVIGSPSSIIPVFQLSSDKKERDIGI
jgi:hypothetical protein